jgi:hypothetical protein
MQFGSRMKRKPTIPDAHDPMQPYIMGVADKLSDDPLLARLFGSRYKVIVTYDLQAKRVTYSFRSPEDAHVAPEGLERAALRLDRLLGTCGLQGEHV